MVDKFVFRRENDRLTGSIDAIDDVITKRYEIASGNHCYSCTVGEGLELYGEIDRMTTSSRNCILLFVKEPMPGKTKRRLAAELGENIAAALYRNFVLDELATLNRCMAECLICFVPVSAENSFRIGGKRNCFHECGPTEEPK